MNIVDQKDADKIKRRHFCRLTAIAMGALLMMSCAAPVALFPIQLRPSLQSFLSANSALPAQMKGSIRLYVYRPQVLLGRLGHAIILVNGVALADRTSSVTENLLQPEAVFVVDVSGQEARITWDQDGRPEGTDKPIEISARQFPVVYLRWRMKPTYGYLEQVSEQQAKEEITSLGFSGYVKLPDRNSR